MSACDPKRNSRTSTKGSVFWGGKRGSRRGVQQLADQLFLRAALVTRLAEAHMCVTGHAELGADGKDYVPTQCTPPFPKNQHSKRPLTGAWFGASLGQAQ